jgi:hypothetical protein
MSLTRREKVSLDAKMNLQVTPLEPTAAALRQVERLGNLRNSKHPFVKLTRPILTTGRHRQLHMIETRDSHVQLLSHAHPAGAKSRPRMNVSLVPNGGQPSSFNAGLTATRVENRSSRR